MTKPVFLFYGDCQSLEMYRAVQRIPLIVEQFDIHMIERVWKPTDVVELPPAHVCDRCTLFWRQIGYDKFGEEPLETLNPRRVVNFVPIYFGGLWPYFQHDPVFPPEDEAGHPHGFYTYQDRFLVEVAKLAVPAPQAYGFYSELVGRPEAAIEHALESGLRLMASWEASTMVPILAFIYSEFKARRLFWTSGHPTSELMGVLLDRLLGVTWPDQFRRGRPQFGAGVRACREYDSLAYDHWIVHPAVAKALRLEWWKTDEKYLQRPDRWFTVEEYVVAYVDERRRRVATPGL